MKKGSKRSVPGGKVLNLAKNTLSKGNPLSKPMNSNEVSDTGTESLKMAYGTIQKGKNAIKTTSRTIKSTTRTVKSTGKISKDVTVATSRTVVFVVRRAVATIKLVVTVVSNIIAAVTNPIVLICVAIVLVLFMIVALVVLLLSGGAAATATNNQAYNAVGLVDIPGQYQNGLAFYDNAVSDRRADFNAIIDDLYYDYNNLTISDLSFMRRRLSNSSTITYDRSFTPDTRKGGMKASWQFTLAPSEIIAIAYVYMEKEANETNGTDHAIYEVTFTQNVFDEIIEKCIYFSDTVYPRQACPDKNCTKHIEVTDNPDYAVALKANNAAADAFNDWAEVTNLLYDNAQIEDSIGRDKHWQYVVTPPLNEWIVTYNRYPTIENYGEDFLDILGEEYEEANRILNDTPKTIETVTYICNFEHDLHSIGLTFYSKDQVMSALGFSESEKQWVSLTEIGFANNPELTEKGIV